MWQTGLPTLKGHPTYHVIHVYVLMAATSATGGATSPGLSANLGFIPSKKQFKWNGSLASLKEFGFLNWKMEMRIVW